MKYSHPHISTGDWLTRMSQIPKYTDTQVPYIRAVSHLHVHTLPFTLNHI